MKRSKTRVLKKLQTRWEPDFQFSEKSDMQGRKHEDITTG